MARKAPWEVVYFDQRPDDYYAAMHGPRGRRWVFVHKRGSHTPACWKRWFEVFEPGPCDSGHPQLWSHDGRRARCPTCDRARQRRRRIRLRMRRTMETLIGPELLDSAVVSKILDSVTESLTDEGQMP